MKGIRRLPLALNGNEHPNEILDSANNLIATTDYRGFDCADDAIEGSYFLVIAANAHEPLVAAVRRMLDHSTFESSADRCECGENGSGLDDEGRPCEHIQAHRALAAADASHESVHAN